MRILKELSKILINKLKTYFFETSIQKMLSTCKKKEIKF